MRQARVPKPDDWEAWVSWLANRADPRPLNFFALVGKEQPLLWELGAGDGAGRTDLLRSLRSGTVSRVAHNGQLARLLEPWFEESESRDLSPQFAAECLAWCHLLPELARLLPAAPWHALFDRLMRIAEDGAAISLQDHPWESQLLAGELPLTLSYLFPEIRSCRAQRNSAQRHLSRSIVELLDGEGLPHGLHLSISRGLLACWTRCRMIGRAAGREPFDQKGREQYRWLVRQSLRLTREDGSSLFSTETSRWPVPLRAAALQLAGDTVSDQIASLAIAPQNGVKKVAGKLPEPSVHSEWSAAALLKQSWKRGCAQFGVNYANRQVQCELSVGGKQRLEGFWNIAISLDGTPISLCSDWSEVCWFSDTDGDYLELQADVASGAVVQRQMYLARNHNFLFLADAYIGTRAGTIEYCASLPTVESVRFQPESETHEGFLAAERRWARVFPLALPEWRSDLQRGTLQHADGRLQLRQIHRGRNLFAPLFLDLSAPRLAHQVTWRALTVAERLTTQEPDVAVAYRVQVGTAHWLVYRALASRGNRTTLGQNFASEFVLARVNPAGEAEKLIEVE